MNRTATDDRLTPHHVSLYISLFSLWNLHHFRNPISIARQEGMQLSKIGSVNTYLRYLKELRQSMLFFKASNTRSWRRKSSSITFSRTVGK